MRPAFAADGVDVPAIVERLAAGQPVQRAEVFVVEPSGPQREINIAVAIDVERRNADIVSLGLVVDNDPQFPVRVVIPYDPALGYGHDVGFLVAIDVGQRHGVAAHLTHMRVDFAGLELRKIGTTELRGSQYQCECQTSGTQSQIPGRQHASPRGTIKKYTTRRIL